MGVWAASPCPSWGKGSEGGCRSLWGAYWSAVIYPHTSQWVGKPQISKFGQQGTIIEPSALFPHRVSSLGWQWIDNNLWHSPRSRGEVAKKPHLLGVTLPLPAPCSQVAVWAGVGTGEGGQRSSAQDDRGSGSQGMAGEERVGRGHAAPGLDPHH